MIPGNPDGTYYFHAVAVDGVDHVGTSPAHFQINIGDPSPDIAVDPTSLSFPNTLIGLEFGDSVIVVEESVNEYVSDDVPITFYEYSLNVSELNIDENGIISDLNLTLYLDCDDNENLVYFDDIKLVSPSGTYVQLTSYLTGYDMYYTVFDDEAEDYIGNGSAPYDGAYYPVGNLSDFDGEEINGTWELRIFSEYWNNIYDMLQYWSLEIATTSTETVPDTSITSSEILISNAGNADLDISTIEFGNASDTLHFSLFPDLRGQSIATGESEVLLVYFHPVTPDTFNTSLSINTNDPDESNITVTLSGIGELGPQPEIYLESDTTYFYSEFTNQTVYNDVVFGNSGDVDLVVSELHLSDTTYFTITDADLAPVSPGSGTAITLSFISPDTLWHTDTLTIHSNDIENPELDVILIGKSSITPVPNITISQDTIDFGAVYNWSDSTVVLTIGNDGDADLFVSDMSLDLGDVYNINPFEIEGPINPGDEREIAVSFIPEDTVFYSDTLRIYSNDMENPVEVVVLQGNGLMHPPFFSVSSDSLIFGEVTIGNEAQQLLRLFNNGADTLTVDLSVDSETFNGFNASPDFVEIPAYSSYDVDVYFTPLDSGLTVSQIIANSNSDEVPQINIHVEGYGVFGDTVVVPDPYPGIQAITDMPEDEGGYVGIQFSGSDFDCCFNTFDITHYSVWRELDLEMLIRHSGETVLLTLPGNNRTRTDSSYWEYLGETPAVGFENYGYTAETIMDSSDAGYNWNNYLIIAHTPNPGILFISEPDSGYSVDNLAPDAPTNLRASVVDTTILLDWHMSEALDLQYYTIYRSTDPELIVDEGNLLSYATDTSFVDASAEWNTYYYYQATATDYSGNTSDASNLVESFVYVNYAPIIDPIDDISTNEDTPVAVEITVYDENGDSLSINTESSDENVITNPSSSAPPSAASKSLKPIPKEIPENSFAKSKLTRVYLPTPS